MGTGAVLGPRVEEAVSDRPRFDSPLVLRPGTRTIRGLVHFSHNPFPRTFQLSISKAQNLGFGLSFLGLRHVLVLSMLVRPVY